MNLNVSVLKKIQNGLLFGEDDNISSISFTLLTGKYYSFSFSCKYKIINFMIAEDDLKNFYGVSYLPNIDCMQNKQFYSLMAISFFKNFFDDVTEYKHLNSNLHTLTKKFAIAVSKTTENNAISLFFENYNNSIDEVISKYKPIHITEPCLPDFFLQLPFGIGFTYAVQESNSSGSAYKIFSHSNFQKHEYFLLPFNQNNYLKFTLEKTEHMIISDDHYFCAPSSALFLRAGVINLSFYSLICLISNDAASIQSVCYDDLIYTFRNNNKLHGDLYKINEHFYYRLLD